MRLLLDLDIVLVHGWKELGYIQRIGKSVSIVNLTIMRDAMILKDC